MRARCPLPAARMLYVLLFVSALLIALNYSIRRHFNRLLPDFRIISVHGPLQLRRYPKLTVAEVRVTGGTSLALRSGRQLLDKYFRDEGISRFALPILAEKIDSADSIWSMSAVRRMHTHRHAAHTAPTAPTAHGTGMHMHCTWHCTCTAHGTALWRSCLRYPSPRPPSASATPNPTPKAETSRPLPRFCRWTWRQRPPRRTRPSSSRSCPRTAPSHASSTGPLARSKWFGRAAAQFPGLLGLALRAHRPRCCALGTSRTGRKAAQGPKGRSGGCGREPRLEVAGFRR